MNNHHSTPADGVKRQRRHPLRLVLASGLCLSLLAGCAVGPDFQPPKVEVPNTWAAQADKQPASAKAISEKQLATWWEVFGDGQLNSLEQRAVAANLDLKLAESRVRQARAARGVAFAGLGPSIDASGSYQRGQGSSGSGGSGQVISDQYQAGFDASWELDIFGGARRDLEASEADLRWAEEDLGDVLVTLTAEVAGNYLELRTLQQRIAVARRNLASQRHTAELTRKRFEAGFVDGLDAANADAQVATTAAQIPTLEASARQTIHNLGVLLGAQPAALLGELSSTPPEAPLTPPAVPVGLPADLLRRRPDIRRAEADIHAATARIGVATAELFPKISLLGSSGYAASQASSWFMPANLIWSFGPSVSWNVFSMGKTKATIEVQKMLEEQSVITYRKTVLVALQEVEDALVASTNQAQRRSLLAGAVAANRKAVDLATRLYAEGHGDFLNVLEAQRSLFSAEDSLAQSSGSMSVDLVALYKALGGGWPAN